MKLVEVEIYSTDGANTRLLERDPIMIGDTKIELEDLKTVCAKDFVLEIHTKARIVTPPKEEWSSEKVGAWHLAKHFIFTRNISGVLEIYDELAEDQAE